MTYISSVRRGNDVLGAVVVGQDVTELKRNQVELLTAQRLASIGTLAAGIAHEINTPVQFVGDNLNFLRDATNDVFGLVESFQLLHREVLGEGSHTAAATACAVAEERAELAYLKETVPNAFARCLEGLERVASIVRSLKEFARPSAQEKALVDLNRAVEMTLTLARNEYKYVADVSTDLGELPPVTCHSDEINQVILNLVANAAHAIETVVRGTERRGRIEIKTRREGGDVVLTVQDNGCGIGEDIRQRVYDPFFTTKPVGKGTGQGLAIVKSVVEKKHAGRVTFDTKPGEGTTFVVRLPIAGA